MPNVLNNTLKLIHKIFIFIFISYAQTTAHFKLKNLPLNNIVEDITQEGTALQKRVYNLLKIKFSSDLADLLYKNAKMSN